MLGGIVGLSDMRKLMYPCPTVLHTVSVNIIMCFLTRERKCSKEWIRKLEVIDRKKIPKVKVDKNKNSVNRKDSKAITNSKSDEISSKSSKEYKGKKSCVSDSGKYKLKGKMNKLCAKVKIMEINIKSAESKKNLEVSTKVSSKDEYTKLQNKYKILLSRYKELKKQQLSRSKEIKKEQVLKSKIKVLQDKYKSLQEKVKNLRLKEKASKGNNSDKTSDIISFNIKKGSKSETRKIVNKSKQVKTAQANSAILPKLPSKRKFPPSLILKCKICREKFALESSLKKHISICERKQSSQEQPPSKKRKRA